MVGIIGSRYYYSVGGGGVALIEANKGGYAIAQFQGDRFVGYRKDTIGSAKITPCYVITCSEYLGDKGVLLGSPNMGCKWLADAEMMHIVGQLKGKDKYRLMRFTKGEVTGRRVSQVFLVFDGCNSGYAEGLLKDVIQCAS